MDVQEAAHALQIIYKFSTIICMAFKAYMYVLEMSRRRWWVRPVNLSRDNDGFFETSTKRLMFADEEHFFKAMRMNPENYRCLLELLRVKLVRHSQRKAISPEIRLSITLLYLAQGCKIQVLARAHKLGISTTRKIIYETCDAIWTELHGVYLAPPNMVDWVNNAEQFYVKSGMPNCLGALDGKHINVVCPKRSGSLYFNYKKNFSVVLMSACDANYCFTFVDVGALGSQSDGGVFVRSNFGKAIMNSTLPVPPDCLLPGASDIFPHYFVADSAFPLRENIMRPYPGKLLPADKHLFNKTLSCARVYIENTFGILARRWEVLRAPIFAKPENVDRIVLATVVLHNFMMLKSDTNYFSDDESDRFWK